MHEPTSSSDSSSSDSSSDSLFDNALLAILSTHTKSVNIVRWSSDGVFLASGSDDNYVLVHRHTPGMVSNQSSFGMMHSSSSSSKSNNKQFVNKESWSRCYTLQGHTMDVLDLDWQRLMMVDHHQSSYTLASASIDNLIIIWTISSPHDAVSRSSSLVSPSKILKGHDSYVKGLAFDPLGR